MDEHSDVSVIICAYTERRWTALDRAVRSTAEQRPKPREVLVVIDHNDRLLLRARSAFPTACVIPNADARGLSGARNTGVRRAQSAVVAFLDDDAEAEPGWLAALLSPYDDPSVMGTGGVAIPNWAAMPPAWLPEEFYWTVGCSYRGLPTEHAVVRNPIGANMSFRRIAFERVGGFVSGIGRVGATPLGCEETELAIRVCRDLPGSRIVHVPGARVHHLVTRDRLRWSYFRSRCWAEGLSKALVTSEAGPHAALASEREYATRTLPAGVLRGIIRGIRGDRSAALRSAAIVAGLVITTGGYLRGRWAAWRGTAEVTIPVRATSPDVASEGEGGRDVAARAAP